MMSARRDRESKSLESLLKLSAERNFTLLSEVLLRIASSTTALVLMR